MRLETKPHPWAKILLPKERSACNFTGVQGDNHIITNWI